MTFEVVVRETVLAYLHLRYQICAAIYEYRLFNESSTFTPQNIARSFLTFYISLRILDR